MLNFKEFMKINEQNTVGKHNDFASNIFLQSDMTGGGTTQNPASLTTSSMDVKMPYVHGLEAILPSKTINSTIISIELKKNPIAIVLADGTQLHLSWDEYKRIQGTEPKVGKSMTVILQRLPNDTSRSPSKINTILCH